MNFLVIGSPVERHRSRGSSTRLWYDGTTCSVLILPNVSGGGVATKSAEVDVRLIKGLIGRKCFQKQLHISSIVEPGFCCWCYASLAVGSAVEPDGENAFANNIERYF